MRFATSDRVFSEDISPTDHKKLRHVLHKLLDEQLDRYVAGIARDLRDSSRIATVDVRTFVHEGEKPTTIIVSPHGPGVVKGQEKKIVLLPGSKANRGKLTS